MFLMWQSIYDFCLSPPSHYVLCTFCLNLMLHFSFVSRDMATERLINYYHQWTETNDVGLF